MNITDLIDSSALGQATKADTARLPLIDERVSTIAHHTEKQQINEQGKAKLFEPDLGYQADPLSCSDAPKGDSRMAVPAKFLYDAARYYYKAGRRHGPMASRLVRI